jgi:hypothetical protein
MAGNRWMRVYSLVEYGSLALNRAILNMTQLYTDATVANLIGTNGQSQLHWTQQLDSLQVDGTPLHPRSQDTADTWLKDLVLRAILSSPGSTLTSNHCSPHRSSLALGKVHTPYLVTLCNRPWAQHSIRQRRELRIMDG